jgi:hypothetical protein
LFLDGCRRNPDFEVCFFDDDPLPGNLPPSARFVAMPLAELKRRFSSATGAEESIPNAYMLCYLRPILGLALGDFLRGCEF